MSLKIKITSILLFLLVFSSFSQEDTTAYPIVRLYGTDTVTIFSMEQSRELAVQNELRKECYEERGILEQEIAQKDTIITNQNGIIENCEEQKQAYKKIAEEKDGLIQICENENKSLGKEVKRQKRGKWIAIGSAVIVGVLGILF